MKKRWIQFALILGLMALACVSVCAAETEEPTYGFTKVSVNASDVILTPWDNGANGGAEVTVDADETRYPGAVKMKIAYNKAQSGNEYLLCVLVGDGSEPVTPSADNMAYIDQQTAETAAVEFTAFPKKPDSGANSVKYVVYLSSNADGDEGITGFTPVATFEYYSSGVNIMLGDVNGDETIDVSDALDALFLSVGTVNNAERPEEEQRLAADVNEDGDVGVDDALNILYCSVGTKTGVKALDDYIDGK